MSEDIEARHRAMRDEDRRTKLRSLRFEIGQLQARIREIEGPDRCEVCACMVLGPMAVSFEGRKQIMFCARYPARVEVSETYHCHEFKRRSDG